MVIYLAFLRSRAAKIVAEKVCAFPLLIRLNLSGGTATQH